MQPARRAQYAADMATPRTLRQALTRYWINHWDATDPQVINFGNVGVPPQRNPTLGHEAAEAARRYREMAVRIVANARKPQVVRWLSSKEAFVREFVLEHLDRWTPE